MRMLATWGGGRDFAGVVNRAEVPPEDKLSESYGAYARRFTKRER